MESEPAPEPDSIIAPNIADEQDTSDTHSDSQSRIQLQGDFSLNNLCFDGNNILEVPCIRVRGPSSPLHHTTHPLPRADSSSSFLDLPRPRPPADAAPVGGSSSVYMAAAVDLFQRLDGKIEYLLSQRTIERTALEEALFLLSSGDPLQAAKALNRHLSSTHPSPDSRLLLSAAAEGLTRRVTEAQSLFLRMQKRLFDLQILFDRIASGSTARAADLVQLGQTLDQQSQSHQQQIDALVSDNNELKEGLTRILEKYGTAEALESRLQSDLFSSVEFLITSQDETIKSLREQIHQKDLKMRDHEKRAEEYDVVFLRRQLGEQKDRLRTLQSENLNFSHSVQKLSEKNIRHKQELILFNEELKKSLAAIKTKNDTIARQKDLINILQSKISGSYNYTVEELRQKKAELERQLSVEQDYLRKNHMEREIQDCAQRLTDFLQLKR